MAVRALVRVFKWRDGVKEGKGFTAREQTEASLCYESARLVSFGWHGWFSWKDDASVRALGEMRPDKFQSRLPGWDPAIGFSVAKADRMVAIFSSFIIGAIVVRFNYEAYFSNED